MEFRRFRWHIIWRIALLLVLGFSTIYVLTQTHFWLVSIWLTLAFILVLIALIRYIEKSHRELRYFLLSIQQGDFSNSYPHKKEDELNFAFHTINDVLKNLRNEKASNLIYLQTVVEHISVAIICFDESQKIVLTNRASKELFQKDLLTSMNSLLNINEQISEEILQLNSGEKTLLKLQLNNRLVNLSIQATEFKLQEKAFKLVSFQDIKAELEANELDSWQKLIRVLTHEIKNSVIPISTLSDVILQMIKDEEGSPDVSRLDEEGLADLIGGIETIESRSKGLANFVKTYDQLTKLPKPAFEEVMVERLVDRLLQLFKADFQQQNIQIEKHLYFSGTILIDPNLIDQVLINLLKNAIEAVSNQNERRLNITASKTETSVFITIADNGPGIPTEILDNIFVPFYTTKEKGTGIGLSLSRQIMRLHNGQITVQSNAQGTSFSLHF
ncbi:histidine kinase/DNA gyrase B/HSP90-like ATPase [Roseivirga pacifica]|uniref:histidine kinase n=1 Tax=Roseivirga pacifica TaxID=1267423 RepID=A0A1I0RSM4_9BACT|nr:ATP-binding protein [Roseivirga pacifica]RKQ49493.1 histidine kinase/DNA gyrase B/HSP90-like ATPase [Roseivirga pacifica]SEW44365.1 Histidine kinase-, DNA gyrase B-, and HSP90-like ATPase [Roseivirga pacifica]